VCKPTARGECDRTSASDRALNGQPDATSVTAGRRGIAGLPSKEVHMSECRRDMLDDCRFTAAMGRALDDEPERDKAVA
jgi:hypothetical protein